jgi:hypothetical protein
MGFAVGILGGEEGETQDQGRMGSGIHGLSDFLKFYPGPSSPTLLCPAGRKPPKRLYGRFGAACGRLLSPWIPHAVLRTRRQPNGLARISWDVGGPWPPNVDKVSLVPSSHIYSTP